MTPINDTAFNTADISEDYILPYCFDVEGEVTLNGKTLSVTKISCLILMNNLANTGTYNAIYYYMTDGVVSGFENVYINNFIATEFNISFIVTNSNGLDSWIEANTEEVSV